MSSLKLPRAIYKPSGRALEYAELACNLRDGCTHACTYCFAAGSLRKDHEAYYSRSDPRPNILEALERDCKRYWQKPTLGIRSPDWEGKRVLLCFTCDPYTREEQSDQTTRKAIGLLGQHGIPFTILTKGGRRATRDFDLLKLYGGWFGTTFTTLSCEQAREWEPGADDPTNRHLAVVGAHYKGIHTWVSLEPVLDPRASLGVIEQLLPVVDEWKLGHWNHDKRAKGINWNAYLADAERLLKKHGCEYMVKRDLLKAAGREFPEATA